MNETLILLLGQAPEDPVRWAFTADGQILEADTAPSAAALYEIADRAAEARAVAAILPGEQAAMRAMSAPPRAASKFRAAASFLLEDDLAEGLERLHVAVSRHESGAGLALAVKKSVMDMWGAVFDEAGFSPDLMTPDFALLPLRAERALIICEADRVSGVFGFQGFAIERPLADAVSVMLAEAEEIETIAAYGDPDTERVEYIDKPVEWRGGSDTVSLFRLYAKELEKRAAPNLIQGDYRKRRDWRGAAGPWRRAAALAAACLVAFAGVTAADGFRSARLADRLNDEALALHRAAFPDEANVNPRDHARRILTARGGAQRFLPLSNQFAESLEESDNIQVDRIRYNAARGEFSINLRFSDINDLEGLKRALAARGVVASETGGGVRRSGGVYVGELRVSLS